MKWFDRYSVALVAVLLSVAPARADGDAIDLKAHLPGISRVELKRDAQGDLRYAVRYDTGETSLMTPAEYADLVYQEHHRRSWIERLFNITSPVGIAWVTLGFLGQALFTGRMLVQWIVSERRRRSHVPELFWWLSLTGGAMLLIYFVWRKDIVGVLGQSTGVLIYVRNLVLIYRHNTLSTSSASLVSDSSGS